MSAINATGPVSESYRQQGVNTFSEAIAWTHRLRYGRNTDRADYMRIFTEQQGTCSTKHAALAALCHENQINAQLMLAICKLTTRLDPNAAELLQKLHVEFFPEAHCYLQYGTGEIDVTFPHQSRTLKVEVLQRYAIQPEQIGSYKVALHQAYLRQWMADNHLDQRFSFDEVWRLREAWIASLYNR